MLLRTGQRRGRFNGQTDMLTLVRLFIRTTLRRAAAGARATEDGCISSRWQSVRHQRRIMGGSGKGRIATVSGSGGALVVVVVAIAFSIHVGTIVLRIAHALRMAHSLMQCATDAYASCMLLLLLLLLANLELASGRDAGATECARRI
jgi:hypothetical protein